MLRRLFLGFIVGWIAGALLVMAIRWILFDTWQWTHRMAPPKIIKAFYTPQKQFVFRSVDGEIVGVLRWDGFIGDGLTNDPVADRVITIMDTRYVMTFMGSIDESAEAFFDFLKPLIDSYIQTRIDTECTASVETLVNDLVQVKQGSTDA